MDEFEREYDALLKWARTFVGVAEDMRPQIRKALDPATPLPDNCPSRASSGELIFRQVHGRLQSVTACVQAVEKAIWKAGK